MDIRINLWAVLLGGIASMVIGMVFYSDRLFGKEWKKLAKIDEKRFEKEMPKVMPLIFAAALVMSFIVGYMTFLYYNLFDVSWLGAGVVTSLILWLMVAAAVYVHNSLDQRSSKLTAITLGNRLISILAMGLIIGWLHP